MRSFIICDFQQSKSREMGWVGRVARMGENRNLYKISIEGPGGKRPLGRPRFGWQDNIKMNISKMGFEGVDWIRAARDRDR
jgi:hypothetical protein